jgi:hypothetical protein
MLIEEDYSGEATYIDQTNLDFNDEEMKEQSITSSNFLNDLDLLAKTMDYCKNNSFNNQDIFQYYKRYFENCQILKETSKSDFSDYFNVFFSSLFNEAIDEIRKQTDTVSQQDRTKIRRQISITINSLRENIISAYISAYVEPETNNDITHENNNTTFEIIKSWHASNFLNEIYKLGTWKDNKFKPSRKNNKTNNDVVSSPTTASLLSPSSSTSTSSPSSSTTSPSPSAILLPSSSTSTSSPSSSSTTSPSPSAILLPSSSTSAPPTINLASSNGDHSSSSNNKRISQTKYRYSSAEKKKKKKTIVLRTSTINMQEVESEQDEEENDDIIINGKKNEKNYIKLLNESYKKLHSFIMNSNSVYDFNNTSVFGFKMNKNVPVPISIENFENIVFLSDQEFIGRYQNKIRSNACFHIEKKSIINVLHFIINYNSEEEIASKIAYAFDRDVKTCLYHTNKKHIESDNQRVTLYQSHDILPSFSFMFMKKIIQTFVKLGWLEDSYTICPCDNFNGLEIIIDLPGAGEDNLKRVEDYYDEDKWIFKTHTLLFNSLMQVNNNIKNSQYDAN